MTIALTISILPPRRLVQGTWIGPNKEVLRQAAKANGGMLAAAFGLRGLSGSGGGFVHDQTAPAASWNIPHALGRIPAVSVYLVSGEEVTADVLADISSVNITFAQATAGKAVIN